MRSSISHPYDGFEKNEKRATSRTTPWPGLGYRTIFCWATHMYADDYRVVLSLVDYCSIVQSAANVFVQKSYPYRGTPPPLLHLPPCGSTSKDTQVLIVSTCVGNYRKSHANAPDLILCYYSTGSAHTTFSATNFGLVFSKRLKNFGSRRGA